MIVQTDESFNFFATIAVENDKGNFDTYNIFTNKRKVFIYDNTKNQELKDLEVTLEDVFNSIDDTDWTMILNNLKDVYQYNYDDEKYDGENIFL